MYSLEALLAVSMIFIAMSFAMRAPPEKPDLETSVMKIQAFNALEYLDNRGDLRQYLLSGNFTRLNSELKAILPGAVQFDADYCTTSCSDAAVPKNQTVVVVDYYIAGEREAFAGKKVRVWLWRK